MSPLSNAGRFVGEGNRFAIGVTLIRRSMPMVKIVCIPMGGRLCFKIRSSNTCGLSNVATHSKVS